jgi:predicted small secreted protein
MNKVFSFNQTRTISMKIFSVLVVAMMLQACGTLGGAVSGAGDDLKAAGGWIKKQ